MISLCWLNFRFQDFNGQAELDQSNEESCLSLQKLIDLFTPSIDTEYYKKAAVNRRNVWAFSSTIHPDFG